MFDQLLQYAASQVVEEINEDDFKDIKLRPEFESRMDTLIKSAYKDIRKAKSRKRLLRFTVAACIVLFVSSSVVFSVEAIRVPVINFFSENTTNSTIIEIHDVNANYDSYEDLIKGKYLPSYIPESYNVSSVTNQNQGKYFHVIFTNNDNQQIDFQEIPSGISTGVDSEYAQFEPLILFEEKAYYCEKNGINTLIFQLLGQSYVLFGPISQNELIKIADSLSLRG